MNLALQSKKVVMFMIMLLVATFVGTTFTAIQPNALFDSDDLKIESGTGVVESGQTGTEGAFTKIMDKYKGVITFISGIAAVTMVAIFIFNFMKLGSTATNPTERQKVITGLIFSGLAAAGLGSVALIVGVFYGLLGD